MADTPDKKRSRTPGEVVARRNEALLKAIQDFQDAVDEFETDAEVSLPSANELLETYLDDHPPFGESDVVFIEGYGSHIQPTEVFKQKRYQRRCEWRHHPSKNSNPWDLRTIPEHSIADLLELLRERLEPGPRQRWGLDCYRHELLATPTGQFPRNTRSAAGTWVANCLAEVLAPGEARDAVWVYCVECLVLAWCNLTGEAPPASTPSADPNGDPSLDGVDAKAARAKLKEIGA